VPPLPPGDPQRTVFAHQRLEIACGLRKQCKALAGGSDLTLPPAREGSVPDRLQPELAKSFVFRMFLIFRFHGGRCAL
jgi:hypothetical protein